jgi:hypothetical protein
MGSENLEFNFEQHLQVLLAEIQDLIRAHENDINAETDRKNKLIAGVESGAAFVSEDLADVNQEIMIIEKELREAEGVSKHIDLNAGELEGYNTELMGLRERKARILTLLEQRPKEVEQQIGRMTNLITKLSERKEQLEEMAKIILEHKDEAKNKARTFEQILRDFKSDFIQ